MIKLDRWTVIAVKRADNVIVRQISMDWIVAIVRLAILDIKNVNIAIVIQLALKRLYAIVTLVFVYAKKAMRALVVIPAMRPILAIQIVTVRIGYITLIDGLIYANRMWMHDNWFDRCDMR